MSAWTPRRFAARFPRRLYNRARLALPVCRDAAALGLWVLPSYALPLYLVGCALGLLPEPVTSAQLFSGAAFLAALGVWGAVFALPVLDRRGQSPDPRLALFLSIHPLLAWLLTALPVGLGAAVYFSLVLAAGCGWAVFQSAETRQRLAPSPAAKLAPSVPHHRVDAAHTLDGPHWLRRPSQRDHDPQLHASSPKDQPADVLPLVVTEPGNTPPSRIPPGPTQETAPDAPDYLLERRIAHPTGPGNRAASATEQGGGHVSGRVTITFAAQQKQQVAHIPFWPPFAAAPRFDCETEGDAEVRIQPFVHPYGVRLELKRVGDCSRPVTLALVFHGELTPATHRAAA
jgi:hypothetical protein